MAFEALEHCCEEQADGPWDVYMPCNQPAERVVYHARDKRAYRMCAEHAWHNIKNRGGEDRGPYQTGEDHGDRS